MSTVLRRIYISPCYTSIFSNGDNVCHYLFVSLDEKALPKFFSICTGSKHLLIQEKIVFFNS